MMTIGIQIEKMHKGIFTGEFYPTYQATMPASWEELSWKSLKNISKEIFIQGADPLRNTPPIILKLLPFSKKAKRSLDIENYGSMYAAVEFLFKQIIFARAKQPQNKIFTPPASLLSNFTFDQLILCDRYLAAFEKSKSISDLRNLCAASCTFFGQDFKSSGSSLKQFITRFMSMRTMLAMYYNYTGLRNALAKKYKKAFSAGKGSSGPGTGNDPWLSLRVSLAGEKFGNPDQVGATKVHNILIHLHDSKIEQDRIKRESKA
jgi:hypothetical protein